MKRFLLRIHIVILAYFVRWFVIRSAVKQFHQFHQLELSQTPVAYRPQLMAMQRGEMSAIRAGNIPSIVDRKSWAWPFLPASINRLSQPLIKLTPYNLRRMSRTPVPRRAMNLIKGAVISQPWVVRPMNSISADDEDEQKARIDIATSIFRHPNNEDSFQTYIEKGLEDFLCFGGFVSEIGYTLDPKRPLKLWTVNCESIRLFPTWSESTPEAPKYAQMTGLKGERGALLFYDDDMMYIKDNPATDTPFGTGKMEVAFSCVNWLLGIQNMAGMAGSDQIHKTWLWFEQPQSQSAYQIIRSHIQNELEGQAKVSVIGGVKKPDVIEIQPVEIGDLLLEWQEMLIRMVANGFDMSAMSLGIEHDINRAVGQVLNDKDFRSAIVPVAKRLQEAFTRKLLHQGLGWEDLEFFFLSLDDPDIETKLDIYSRLYSINAVTPAGVLKAMNMPPLNSPFADLTQFECMLINIQAMAQSQQQTQDHMMNQQYTLQQKMQRDQQEEYGYQQQQISQPQSSSPGSVARGGQPQSSKGMSLPKFPISAGRYTAKQIQQMPVNKLSDWITSSRIKASDLLAQMEQQEPGILEELSEEVTDFLDDRLKEEMRERKSKPVDPKILKQWLKVLKTKYARQNKRTTDLATYLQKYRYMGRPVTSKDAGKPGVYKSIGPGRTPV